LRVRPIEVVSVEKREKMTGWVVNAPQALSPTLSQRERE
jgi:hypothetical protein